MRRGHCIIRWLNPACFRPPFCRQAGGVAQFLVPPIMLFLFVSSSLPADPLPFPRAQFVVKTRLFIKHTAIREFHGPDCIQLANGDILMAASWGRPRGDFKQFAAKYPVPQLYRSQDNGRTWREQGRMKMKWNLPGMIRDGGVSFLRLQDGREPNWNRKYEWIANQNESEPEPV